MSIVVICPCGKKLMVNDAFAGMQVACPACRHDVTVPEGNDRTGSGPAIDADNREQQGVRTHRKRARKPVLVGSLVLAALVAALVAAYFLFLRNDHSNKPAGTDPSSGQRADKPSASSMGYLNVVDSGHITGWAWDPIQPDNALNVNLFDNDKLLITVPADQFRQDLFDKKIGNGKHRFLYSIPAKMRDGKEHVIRAKIVGTEIELKNSPKTAIFKPRQ